MRRRLLGRFVWLVAIPLVGSVRLAWAVLRKAVWMRNPGPLAIVALTLVLAMPNPLRAQVSTEGTSAIGHWLLVAVLPLAVGASFRLGYRSTVCRWLRRTLR